MEDSLVERDCLPNQNREKAAMNDQLIEMLRLGAMIGQTPLILSQCGRQIPDSYPPRRKAWGLLIGVLLFLAVAVLPAIALPRMLGQRADAKTASAKAVSAAPGDAAEFVLNAICIVGDDRSAIINGREYRKNDTLARSSSAAPPWVVADIQPDNVWLECRGKRLRVCYANSTAAGQGTRREVKPIPKETLPPELLPAANAAIPPVAGGENLGLLLEQLQKGVPGLDKMLATPPGGKE